MLHLLLHHRKFGSLWLDFSLYNLMWISTVIVFVLALPGDWLLVLGCVGCLLKSICMRYDRSQSILPWISNLRLPQLFLSERSLENMTFKISMLEATPMCGILFDMAIVCCTQQLFPEEEEGNTFQIYLGFFWKLLFYEDPVWHKRSPVEQDMSHSRFNVP